MTMIIVILINILLDVAIEREPFVFFLLNEVASQMALTVTLHVTECWSAN